MNPAEMIAQLESCGEALCSALRGLTPEQARLRPSEGKWSLVDIAAHLLDEEREDFRARLRMLLADPTRDWPPNDPAGWVTQRGYQSRDLAETVASFARERADSLSWLRALVGPDWNIAKHHPRYPSVSAGDLLAAWVAHDLLHLAQIARTRLAVVEQEAAPYSTAYAS